THTFCGLSETKVNIGLAGITIHDVALQGMLEDVTRDFQDYMDYWMFLYDWTEIFDIETTQERCIQLKEWPVWSVAGLSDAGLTVTSDLYKLYPAIGEICLEESFFTKGLQTVEVTYRAGYTPISDIPKSLRGACQREVSSRFRSREDEDLSYEKIGDYAYRKDTHQDKASYRTYGFSSATRRVLDHFRDQAV
ncbi:unnamed protein product, partial [marine sediment metagenome]